MIDNNKVYDGDELEVLVNHVIVGGFISNDSGVLFGGPEQVEYLKQRQHDGETIYRILESGIDGRHIKSYALLAVVRMMQRGWVEPMTLGQLMDFLNSAYVGGFQNVAAFARDLASQEAMNAGTEAMFSRVADHVDWTEFAEDHYDKDFRFVSVNDHRRLPEGSIFVFKKENKA